MIKFTSLRTTLFWIALANVLFACEQGNKPAGLSLDKTEQAAEINENAQQQVDEQPLPINQNSKESPAQSGVVQREVVQDGTAQSDVASALIKDSGFSSTPVTAEDILAKDNKPATPNCQNLEADNEVEKVESACQKISNRLASVSMKDCMSAKLRTTQCYSNNKFPILMREFPPLEDRVPKGKVLLIGGTHGDELTSVSIVFKWIQILNKHHSGLFHWHIIPVMNPDGLLLKSATRTNANGVDLNRNLPTSDWYEKAIKYWRNKTKEDPRKYPGLVANSEPENQWLVDEINQFQPDAIVSVHAPYGIVDFDAPVLNKAPRSLGHLRLNLLGTYPGSLGNYAGINRKIPVITLELPHSWVMPKPAQTQQIWEDMVGWLVDNVGKAQAKKN